MIKDAGKHPNYHAISEEDRIIIHDMGYKQDLHRGLNAFTNFAFGYTEVAALVGVCSLYDYGLSTGGPAWLVWGWVIAFSMTMIVSYSLAEICSAYPSAGSVYHWSGQLAPIKYAPLAAYACGWTNFIGNAVGDASFAYAWANFLDAAMRASGMELSLSTPSLVLISIIVLLLWSLINCARIDQLGWINTLAAIIHCGSTVLIIITLLLLTPQLSTSSFVFTSYYNETGFTNRPYIYSIGLLAALWSFSGYEASAHLAQETSGSRTDAPMGIVWTCFASGIGGLGVILALLFATDDINAVIYGDTGNAAIEVFLRATGPVYGAGLAWILVINVFFAGMSSVAVTGRITYALSRDGAFPFSEYLSWVHPSLKSPVIALIFVWVLDSLLQMLPLINEDAFISITDTATIAFQVSYAIPITLKLLYENKDFPRDAPMSLVSKKRLTFKAPSSCKKATTSFGRADSPGMKAYGTTADAIVMTVGSRLKDNFCWCLVNKLILDGISWCRVSAYCFCGIVIEC
eukprot:gene13242-28030_t